MNVSNKPFKYLFDLKDGVMVLPALVLSLLVDMADVIERAAHCHVVVVSCQVEGLGPFYGSLVDTQERSVVFLISYNIIPPNSKSLHKYKLTFHYST